MNSSVLPAADPQQLAAPTPTRFTLLHSSAESGLDARHDESLLELCIHNGPLASIWQTQRSLVVPRSYRHFDAFEDARQHFAGLGWPVTVRQTGGGIVPQGPGILNLSLAYTVQGPPMQHSEPGYQRICQLLADALRALGIETFPAAVEGSFCDGRYNLAVDRQGKPVKIAGTAQSWRRIPGSKDGHMGLVHALVLLDTDTTAVTETANAFEAALGSERRYEADKVVSAAEWLGSSYDLQNRFENALERALANLRV